MNASDPPARRARRYLGRLRRTTRAVASAAYHEVREKRIGQFLPVSPRVLQFPVNDICNSKCVMCDIWRRKRDVELTADQFRSILSDSLFETIEYVGISGGEPTLRADLAELGAMLVATLPKLVGIGIITNALREDMVATRILALRDAVRAGGVQFNAMVSLDGIGDGHDCNRGRAGNFASAVAVIERLRKADCVPSIGCTLTPLNCYGADDVLRWCRKEGLSNIEFRLGVEIARLYNEGYDERQHFSAEQRFHLTMFFDKLAKDLSTPIGQRRFYASLAGQLGDGQQRTAGCDWQSCGVTLDCRGGLSYCSVKSPILGSTLEESASEIYRAGLPVRRAILKQHCATCKHDLVGPPNLDDVARDFVSVAGAPVRRIVGRLHRVGEANVRRAPADTTDPKRWRSVMITGWYGTETQGDKAILAETVATLRRFAPNAALTLTSLDPRVSAQTSEEIDDGRPRTINLASAAQPDEIERHDAVLIGGGPLEEIPEMRHLLGAFLEANRQRKERIIFGCGVGPLHSETITRQVRLILDLTTRGFLRDAESLALARTLGSETMLSVGCDPGFAHVRRRIARLDDLGHAGVVAGLLRATTHEYENRASDSDLLDQNAAAAARLAGLFDRIATSKQVSIDLLPMHSLHVGGDDRVFNRDILEAMHHTERAHAEHAYLTFGQLLARIRGADGAIAMRYHGHLFCAALGVPFLSVDYTGRGGKVNALLRRLDYERWSIPWNDMLNDRAWPLDEFWEARQSVRDGLWTSGQRMVAELDQAYQATFEPQ
jgi:polysaccharide pyruvyl transferase WcaK-like protein/MoaA/NifB/PqqE/SkfB family radical SAM enzyme